MGATLIGVLAILLAIVALIVWGLIAWVGVTQALAVLFIVTCLLMMLVILIQKPKGGGLSGAFGGAGGGGQQAAFGAKTGDVLTVVTVCLFVLFLGLAMGLTWSSRADRLALPEAPAETQTQDGAGDTTPQSGTLETETPVRPVPGGEAPAPEAPAEGETTDAPAPAEQPAATTDNADTTNDAESRQ